MDIGQDLICFMFLFALSAGNRLRLQMKSWTLEDLFGERRTSYLRPGLKQTPIFVTCRGASSSSVMEITDLKLGLGTFQGFTKRTGPDISLWILFALTQRAKLGSFLMRCTISIRE
jgi:hypothetical protein